jgi:dipeptidyl-peptidase-4
VVFAASEEPTESHVWRWTPDGGLVRLTTEPGVHAAAARGDVSVIVSASVDRSDVTTTVWRLRERVGEIASFAQQPILEPTVPLLRLGPNELRSAILLPGDGSPGATVLKRDGRLPVLLDPYGGPQAQRVVAARGAFLASQWLADQGFAVLVADGRGTPARGLAWERAVHRDLASPALEDQVEALHAAAALDDRLDLTRVAIRGWSFGGYLAALAVLRRPDVFHAAVAGAPVTDWRLYDTHYTERFLGLPQDDPDAYRQSSILDAAAALTRPLLLIHGLADDNVVVAHTLRFSQALMEAGRPHAVLPLSGVTHMTAQEVVAENLLLLQVAFLRDALGIAPPG